MFPEHGLSTQPLSLPANPGATYRRPRCYGGFGDGEGSGETPPTPGVKVDGTCLLCHGCFQKIGVPPNHEF